MPTIVTHGFVATLVGKSAAVGRMPARFWILSVLCSVFPDADVLGFPLGIRYDDMLGHRGLSHSLVFAIVLSWIVAFVAFPRLPERWTRYLLFSYFFVVTASHGALDAMTREKMNLELQRIWSETKKTVLFITHSIPESIFLSDRILVMTERPGRIAAIYAVPLPRPRTLAMMGSSEFTALAQTVRAHFYAQGTLDG